MGDDSTKKDGASYYYAIGGAEHGPVDKARIIQLAQMGSIRAQTHVWTDAMPVKTAAGKLPFLVAHLRREPRRGAQLAVGGLVAAVGIGVLGAFLWMVPPAAAREGESACRGIGGLEQLKAQLCPEGQSCAVPLQAPDFTMIGKDNKQVKLSAFRGKVVLLNFWASWCGTCKAEKPGLAQMSRDFPELEVVALSSDSEWSKVLVALVKSLNPNLLKAPASGDEYTFDEAKENYGRALPKGVPFQVYLDPPQGDDTIGTIARRWGIDKVPETALIDRDGKIRAYFVNKRDWTSSAAQTCIRAVLDGQ
ncbi:MAG TPA: redoxin domain-containing protein [Kofleriaceae bacterium]|nr:redoxin domain-containing protein [Kofleriaceae bacterium]